MFYQNVRGFHWKVKGDKFFELHAKFEELYNDLFIKIDEVAERILTLGGLPYHSFSEYSKISEIVETTSVKDGVDNVRQIVASFEVLLQLQREILAIANDADDEGTASLMSDYIREGEKLVWMYTAYLD